MKKIYFAHSMLDYNSKKEKDVLKIIKKTFPNPVICPNNDIGELGGIEPYLRYVEKCGMVVVLEHDRSVGRGVFVEVCHAIRKKIPVVVYRVSKKKFLKVTDAKVMEDYGWRRYAVLRVEGDGRS